MRSQDLQAGEIYAYERRRINEYSQPTRVLLLDASTWAKSYRGKLTPSGLPARTSGTWTGDDIGYPILLPDYALGEAGDVTTFATAGIKPDGAVPEGYEITVARPRELYPLSVFDDIARMREASEKTRAEERARRETVEARVAGAWQTILAGTGRTGPTPRVDEWGRVKVSVSTLEAIAARLDEDDT